MTELGILALGLALGVLIWWVTRRRAPEALAGPQGEWEEIRFTPLELRDMPRVQLQALELGLRHGLPVPGLLPRRVTTRVYQDPSNGDTVISYLTIPEAE